jgi:dTDP-4-dehydrorhamnose 3,5-epimerase
MFFLKNKVNGSYVISLNKISDTRGFFSRVFCKDEFRKKKINFDIPQINTSLSKIKGTIRGFHFQLGKSSEAKLVKCIRGSIYDVVIDLRKSSKTYLKSFGIKLTSTNRKMLYIPKGCAHAFQSLEDNSELVYLVDCKYDPSKENGVRFDDRSLKIKWPLKVTSISKKDKNWPDLIIKK